MVSGCCGFQSRVFFSSCSSASVPGHTQLVMLCLCVCVVFLFCLLLLFVAPHSMGHCSGTGVGAFVDASL